MEKRALRLRRHPSQLVAAAILRASSLLRREIQPFMSRIFLCQFPCNLITQLLGQIDAGHFP
ncbi:MAG: hypothetical protein WB689_19600, partial [Xanthobacteraceae bacterium]